MKITDPFSRLKPLVEEALTLVRGIRQDLTVLEGIYVELKLANDLKLLTYNEEVIAVNRIHAQALIEKARSSQN